MLIYTANLYNKRICSVGTTSKPAPGIVGYSTLAGTPTIPTACSVPPLKTVPTCSGG